MRLKCQETDYAWLKVHSALKADRHDFIVWDSTVLFEQELRQQSFYLDS